MPATPRLTFRCPPELATHAADRARLEGISLSAALRALMSDYAAGRMPSPRVARALERLADELRRHGVNLNQAARALNTGRYPADLSPLLGRLVDAVRRVLAQLDTLTGAEQCQRKA